MKLREKIKISVCVLVLSAQLEIFFSSRNRLEENGKEMYRKITAARAELLFTTCSLLNPFTARSD